jgi:hypothetical protein
MYALHLEPNRSGPPTPSSFGSPLSSSLMTFPTTNFHPPYRVSSFSGEDFHQWSLALAQQSSYGQPDSYLGSPLVPSGLSVQSHKWFRPTSSFSHNSDRQLEELKICCNQLTNRNTALEAEVVTIKWVRGDVQVFVLPLLFCQQICLWDSNKPGPRSSIKSFRSQGQHANVFSHIISPQRSQLSRSLILDTMYIQKINNCWL